MKRVRWFQSAAALAFGGALALTIAVAPLPAGAQPAAPPPGGPAPGAQPGAPGARPAAPPGRMPAPPGGRPPGRPRAPGIQPGFPPGMNPGGAQLPAGHPEVGGLPVAKAPVGPQKDAHGHCPGHGPMDSLREHAHINWWQGLLGIDNEKAKSESGLNKLLYRYYNTQNECDPSNQEPPILAQVINLAILLFLFAKFGKKPLAEALAKRKKTIVEEMEAAKSLGDAAEDRLAEYEEQFENLEDRRVELREESQLQWETEKKRILAEAEERRARMRRDAEFRVQQELKEAQQELLREAIEGATRAAEELLTKKLSQSDHDRLADEYLGSIAAVVREGDKPRVERLGGAS